MQSLLSNLDVKKYLFYYSILMIALYFFKLVRYLPISSTKNIRNQLPHPTTK